jgi:hypothetical protein
MRISVDYGDKSYGNGGNVKEYIGKISDSWKDLRLSVKYLQPSSGMSDGFYSCASVKGFCVTLSPDEAKELANALNSKIAGKSSEILFYSDELELPVLEREKWEGKIDLRCLDDKFEDLLIVNDSGVDLTEVQISFVGEMNDWDDNGDPCITTYELTTIVEAVVAEENVLRLKVDISDLFCMTDDVESYDIDRLISAEITSVRGVFLY